MSRLDDYLTEGKLSDIDGNIRDRALTIIKKKDDLSDLIMKAIEYASDELKVKPQNMDQVFKEIKNNI